MSRPDARKPLLARSLRWLQAVTAMALAALVVAGGGLLLDWATLGTRRDLLYSDVFEGALAALLALVAVYYYNKRQQLVIRRLRVISDVNHHVRNALTGVLYSVELSKDKELVQVTSAAVERIDWALRELLGHEEVSGSDPAADKFNRQIA
ncbi:MAG TPA: hypothetical protein VFQ00_10740 [Terriglobales bacterium]|nr:hypothetical protein [Terriglobales bacterium]